MSHFLYLLQVGLGNWMITVRLMCQHCKPHSYFDIDYKSVMDKNLKLDHLTGLRYFAALLVFLSHLKWDGSNLIFIKVFESGYVGVSFFFILSGFVLSYSYKGKILNNSVGFVSYILLRLARLTPLHFLTTLPFVFFYLYSNDLKFFNLIVNIFYLQSWFPSSHYYFSFNAPSWSLSNEMFFYCCFFFLVFVKSRVFFWFFILLLISIICSAFYVEFEHSQRVFFGDKTFSHWLFYIFPGFRLLEFIVGMMLFKLWEADFRLPGFMIIPSYIFLIASMYFAGDVPEPFRMSLFFLPFVILFFYAHLTEGGFIVRFFSTKIMIILGNSSFAFYLIHVQLIGFLQRFSGRFEISNLSFFFFSLLVVSFLSIAVHSIYERRCNACLKILINKRFPNLG